ncbi:MAG TPA: RAMP superfamily CRISPR-associated protein [Bacillota bacterium]|nr:RAMP superfamily CRISPR-associated protein [Bacillota bacterium]
MSRFKLQVTVEMMEGWHVGGGKGASGNVGYILRDHQGFPYVPGSQWKGVMRDLIRQGSGERCSGSSDCECMVCRLFGAPGNQRGAVRFSDLKIDPAASTFKDPKTLTFIRAGVRLDPYRNVVADGALYLKEAVAEAQLKGEMDGYLAKPDQDLPVLLIGLHRLEALGGGKGQGMGGIAGIRVELSGIEWRQEWGGRAWRYD